MFFDRVSIKLALILIILTTSLHSAVAAEGFSRTRHKAAMLALLAHNPVPRDKKTFTYNRSQLIAFCNSFIEEGGYSPQRLQLILEVKDPALDYVAMLVNELEGNNREFERPDELLIVSCIALAYAKPSIGGIRAAIHAGRMSTIDDLRDPVARAAYAMLIYAIEGGINKKDELINVGAMNALDERAGVKTAEGTNAAKEIRAVRLREWRKLPPESTQLGRLCRALHIWHRTKSWSEAIKLGNKMLRYRGSRQYLAILAAAWTDLPYMPENFVWEAMKDKEIRDTSLELYDLANEGILSTISADLIYNNPGQTLSTYSKSSGTPENSVDNSQSGDPKTTYRTPANPATPAQPSQIAHTIEYTTRIPAHTPLPPAPGEEGNLDAQQQMRIMPAIDRLAPLPKSAAYKGDIQLDDYDDMVDNTDRIIQDNMSTVSKLKHGNSLQTPIIDNTSAPNSSTPKSQTPPTTPEVIAPVAELSSAIFPLN